MNSGKITSSTCPHLGLADDALTSLAYPSVWNYCYRSQPVVTPKLRHQTDFCLCSNYSACPVMARPHAVPMPKHIQALNVRAKTNKASFRWKLGGGIVGIIAVLLILINKNQYLDSPINAVRSTPSIKTIDRSTEVDDGIPTVGVTPSATIIFTQAVEILPVVETSIFPSLTPPQAPASTLSPSKHGLDVLIGGDRKLLIHKIQGGENLNQFAALYNTSIEAILTINGDLKTPVWVGVVIIIPVGFTDVSSLPSFEALQLTKTGQSVELIAEELGVDVNDLSYYNAINAGENLMAGDWLLIPRLVR